MELCQREQCSGCGACAYVCGKRAIHMVPDSIGTIYPVLDKESCVSCGACRKVCPVIHPVKRRDNLAAYAAWSNSPEERKSSASGGVAAELYRYYLRQGFYVGGAKVNENLETDFCMTNDFEQMAQFKNSKYVFSTMYSLFPEIRELLGNKKQVMIIGLPCQIAALRNIFNDDENLFLADVVCHGTANQYFLEQHRQMVERKTGKSVAYVSFRDPMKDTAKYFLSFFDSVGNCIYSKRTCDGDLYQYGYHRAISYRENCYDCQYACVQRVSDVTLSDYKGLGTMDTCDYSQENVSLVLVHTEKGQKLINLLVQENRITADPRPLMEGIQRDPQLNHPSIKTYGREIFEKRIKRYQGDFERTMVDVVKAVTRRQLVEKSFRKGKTIIRNIVRKGLR